MPQQITRPSTAVLSLAAHARALAHVQKFPAGPRGIWGASAGLLLIPVTGGRPPTQPCWCREVRLLIGLCLLLQQPVHPEGRTDLPRLSGKASQAAPAPRASTNAPRTCMGWWWWRGCERNAALPCPGEACCLESSTLLCHGVQDAAQSECPITVRHG